LASKDSSEPPEIRSGETGAKRSASPEKPSDRDRQRQLAHGASQQFPYPGKLKLRGAVADREADIAKAHVEVVSQEKIETLKTARFHLAYLRHTLGKFQRDAALLQQKVQQAEAHYSTGQGNQQEVEITAYDQHARLHSSEPWPGQHCQAYSAK